MTEQDELIKDVVVQLREMQGGYARLLDACDRWLESPDSGLDPDQVPGLDERMIVQEHLGQVAAGLGDLLRMAAAVKGKHALAMLVVP